MTARIWASVAMTAIGASLLAAAMFAGTAAGGPEAASQKVGGSLTITSRSDFDYADSSLAYFSHSWNMMAATNLQLLYYPHSEGAAGGRLTPMAARGMPNVSANGRIYTFRIKPGFKFNTGANVTAANFARAFARGLNPASQSPASSFLDDVASYKAVNASTFRVVLEKNAPDFLSRMSMQFFSAVPTNLPFTADGIKAPVASAGPYFLKEWNEGKSALAVRNPNWKNNVEPFKSLGFKNYINEIRWLVGADPATQRLQCEKGEADICSFPPAQAAELSEKYGVNRNNGQFFVKRQTTLWYIAMNTSRPLFGNTKLRQGVANALDRRFMVAQHGFLAGKRTDQFLPYPMPGFKEANLYSLKGPNYTKAKALAQGNTGDGKAVMYTFNVGQGPPIAQSVQFNLKQIGIDVEIRQFDRVVQHEKAATRGEPFDLMLEGWGMDYPDPSNFINVLLDGRRIQADNNVNVSYFNNAAMHRAMDRANSLSGQARLNAYGALDVVLMRDHAPVAPYISTNARILTSTKVGCYAYTSIQSTLLTQICTR
jgi:ABC-type oligopeptide transport system substrate-binding subunit